MAGQVWRLGVAVSVGLLLAGCADRVARVPDRSSIAADSSNGAASSIDSRNVSYHGITLTVPLSWGVGPVFCSSPTRDWVEPDTEQAASCPAQVPPTRPTSSPAAAAITVISLMPTGVDPLVEQLATAATTVDGHAARRGSGTAEGSRPTSVLLLPDPGVVIAITGPTEADPDAIFGTVRVAPRDGLGCQDHVASFTPSSSTASTLLVPGQPKSGVICEYLLLRSESTAVDWLIGSTELTSAQLSELPGLVNALPPAASSPSAAPTPLGPFIWFELHDADGTTRTLAATLDTSPTLVTDGRHTVTTNNPQLLPDAFDH